MEKYLMKICKTASKYAKNKADKVYIYLTRINNRYGSTVFFERKGKVVSNDKLNDTLDKKDKRKFLKFDVSHKNMNAKLGPITDVFMELCKENLNVRIIKVIYEVKSKKIDYEVSQKEIPKTISRYDLYKEWYNEVKEQVENK